MVRAVMGAIVGLLLVACSGDNEGATGNGGTASDSGGAAGGSPLAGASGSGGSAGSSGSAGSGGNADVPRGAISLHIVPGEGCTLAEQWVDFPVVDGGHPVTATETVETIADGATEPYTNSSGMMFDTEVSRLACDWVVRESTRVIHVGFRFGRAGRDGTLSMSAGITVGESQTEGIVLVGQDWGDANYGGQCTYTALEVDDATRSVRGEITCPALDLITDTPDTQPHETCTLPVGYYAFENCTPK